MSGLRVKETMEQIHIPEEMQEQIMINVRNRMENEKAGTRNSGKGVSGRKRAAAAAALILAAGLVGIPVQAIVQNYLTARMEEIPEEEVLDMMHMLQGQKVEADSFSREYTAGEKERMKELYWFYKNGLFPEKTLPLVNNAEEAEEGIFCYIWDIGFFCLPDDRELTDEEILEIVDFNYTRNYVLGQSSAAQEVRKEMQEEQDRLRERIQAAGGISEDTALEIAKKRMKEELGASAEGKNEIRISLADISKADYENGGDIGYMVIFRDPKDCSTYICTVDSADGSIMDTWRNKAERDKTLENEEKEAW